MQKELPGCEKRGKGSARGKLETVLVSSHSNLSAMSEHGETQLGNLEMALSLLVPSIGFSGHVLKIDAMESQHVSSPFQDVRNPILLLTCFKGQEKERAVTGEPKNRPLVSRKVGQVLPPFCRQSFYT